MTGIKFPDARTTGVSLRSQRVSLSLLAEISFQNYILINYFSVFIYEDEASSICWTEENQSH